MANSLDSAIKFKDLCDLFEKLYKAKGSQKVEELQRFIRKCRGFGRKLKTQIPDANTSLFPIMRLLLPTLERERGPYGMQAKNLTNLYIDVFCLGRNSANAEKLKNYKKPVNATRNDDLAETIYFMMRPRLCDDSSVTVQTINKFLDKVAECNETNQRKNELFMHFMRKITAVELKWLTRILLKDMRLGLAQKKVFEAIHPNAEELFNVTSSLQRVCNKFSDLDAEDLEGVIGIEIFSHVKPMLLERFKIEDIAKLFKNEEQYYVQTKFDGERSQIHMKNGKFKYFTRQGYDITDNTSYGKTADSGKFLTSNIAQLLEQNCQSIILDGEIMGWHKQRKSFGSKALNYDVKKLSDKSQHQPCFIAYDILLFNDEQLVDKPYIERLNYLKSAFTEKEGVLMLAKTTPVSKVDQIRQIFNTALDNDDEGIVVKRHDVFYKPNVREKSGCYKIKAEYSDGLVQDLDLIILGGYYGQGRCSGIVSSFLVGVASPPTNKNGMPSEFFGLVGVRSGLSDEDLRTIQQKFKLHWKNSKPPGIIGPKSQPPDLWISPKQSIILQLRASEIIKTQGYPLGYSLRFPRVLKVRYDKPWHDTCSTTEFKSLIKDGGAVQKLTKRKAKTDDIANVSDDEEKPKIRKTQMSLTTVYGKSDSIRNQEVTRLSRLFENKEFSVINGNDELSKNDVIRILKEHSAKVVENPGKDTFCVLVGDPTIAKAQNKITSKKYDVVSLAWLKRAVEPKNLCSIQEFYPWELFATRPSTKYKLDEIYDQYMDNYTEDLDEKSLKRVMDKTEEIIEKDTKVSHSEMKKLDKLLFNGISPFSIFRGITGYFHNQNDVEKHSFTFMGGQAYEELQENVNYIFTNDDLSAKDLNYYKDKVKNLNSEKIIVVIRSKWIGDCFAKKQLLSIKNYVV